MEMHDEQPPSPLALFLALLLLIAGCAVLLKFSVIAFRWAIR